MKRVLATLLLSLLLSACSNLPSVNEIEKLVRADVLENGLGDLFFLENFRKVNGFQESDNVYIVDVEYDLVFQRSFVEVVREIRADPTGPQYGVFGSRFILNAIQSNFGQFEKGDRIHKTRKVRLHHTEQGWLLAN